jgi:ribonuclease VapC
VFDASAILCFLHGEEGADVVEGAMEAGGLCCAANWAEVAQKLLAHGQDWSLAKALLVTYGIAVEPVLATDAEAAARRWRTGSVLSLADRLCLATADRLSAVVWTADRTWGESETVRQIR